MTISIQGSNAALLALDSLSTQPGPLADTAQTTGFDPASADQGGDPAASILDVSGGAAAAALGGLTGGLANAASIADAALSAGSTVQGLLQQLQQAAQSASDPSLPADQRAALDSSFKDGLAKIEAAVAGASLDGVNLIDGSSSAGQSVVATATLTGTDLSLTGPLIGLGADASLSDPAQASAIAAQLGQAIDNVGQALGQIATQSQAIDSHLSLVSQAALALAPGSAGVVGTGLSADGARLQALQVQQALAGSGSAVANQAPQAILALFQ